MKVVLAEKPSVARDLARFLKAGRRCDGYFEGNGYQVTWAFGHLVSLCDFEDYDPSLKKWQLDPLPFIPTEFRLKLAGDRTARKQFTTIKRLFRAAAVLICATDAGREGELIFRYIRILTGASAKPFSRLWLSSLTQDAIRDGFNRLRTGHDFDNLFAAARCRSEADWIVGLNATREYTVSYGERQYLWTVGRVQTPVLAIIVRRDDEIRTFVPTDFWELCTRYRNVCFKFRGDRFTKREKAEALLQRVIDRPFSITDVSNRKDTQLPPLLYDLTDLQRDMNRRYNMSAAKTLNAAQQLYENKLITYPRTDSRYLGSDMKPVIAATLRTLSTLKPTEIGRLDLGKLPFNRRIINDNKVTDHHAIVPTGALPSELDAVSRKVYDAVVTRLIAVFYPPCIKQVTTVDGVSEDVPFRTKGVRVVDPGWTTLYPQKVRVKKKGDESDDDANDQELPVFQIGERGPHEPFLKEARTKPPKHFSENTLLASMETAGKLVDDDELKEALKEKGIGTPATRAAIIELLIKRNYIIRDKKTLIATDAGRYLIALIRNDVLKSPEMTGEWELKLKQIETGKMPADRFMREISEFIRKIHTDARTLTIDPSVIGKCPRCERNIIEGKRGYGCSGWKEGCSVVVWKTYKGHAFSVRELRELFQLRRILHPVTINEDGKTRSVVIYLGDNGVVQEISIPIAGGSSRTARAAPRRGGDVGSDDSIGNCPLCAHPVIQSKRGFGCSNWRNGCKFIIWKTIAGKRISSKTARTLLGKGKTSVLKGFKSKTGNSFTAALILDDGVVSMEFGRSRG